MQFSSSRRFFTGCLAALQLFVAVISVAPLSASAQSIDSEPPVVDFQPVDEGVLGESQVFTTTVSDNEGVSSVVLHFRLDSDSAYVAREMQVLSGTDIYTTTIETNDAGEDVTSIQYFIEAKDYSGNRSLEGFAFNPVERLLSVRELATNSGNSNTSGESSSMPSTGMSTRQKVLLGLLGVVVVGALASSSSSGGGGASEPGVDVTIVVDPIQ